MLMFSYGDRCISKAGSRNQRRNSWRILHRKR